MHKYAKCFFIYNNNLSKTPAQYKYCTTRALHWNGSFLMYLSTAASLAPSNADNTENPSSSTKQISCPSGSAKMITRTVAFPGVSNVMSGVKIGLLLALIRSSIVACIACGTANAMRP